MPDLPGITGLTQAQYDRVLSAVPGATLAEKAQNYKNWQLNRVLDLVESSEMSRAQASIRASLPARPADITPQ